jgi:hypothetical protein
VGVQVGTHPDGLPGLDRLHIRVLVVGRVGLGVLPGLLEVDRGAGNGGVGLLVEPVPVVVEKVRQFEPVGAVGAVDDGETLLAPPLLFCGQSGGFPPSVAQPLDGVVESVAAFDGRQQGGGRALVVFDYVDNLKLSM